MVHVCTVCLVLSVLGWASWLIINRVIDDVLQWKMRAVSWIALALVGQQSCLLDCDRVSVDSERVVSLWLHFAPRHSSLTLDIMTHHHEATKRVANRIHSSSEVNHTTESLIGVNSN